MSATEPLYLDDLHVDQRFTSGSYVMKAARIKEFAAEFDPQPFHLDETAAELSIFKGLAASGWHTAAAAMRLLVTGGLPLASGIIGLGGEIAWPKPTRPGDTLHVESEIVDIAPSRSKPHQGIVTALLESRSARRSIGWQRADDAEHWESKTAFRRCLNAERSIKG